MEIPDVIGSLETPFGTLMNEGEMTGGARISDYVEDIVLSVKEHSLTNDFINSRLNLDIDNIMDNMLEKVSSVGNKQ